MTRNLTSLAIALAATAIGCMGARGGHARQGQAPAPQTAQAPARPAPAGGAMPACAMEVPGTQLAVADAPGGVALTFTTPDAANVADLRSRVHAMAEMHDAHHRAGGMMEHGGMHGGMHGDMPGGMHGDMGGMHGGMQSGTGSAGAPDHAEHGAMAMPPPSRAVAEDVEGGARVMITPDDPADLDRLRSTVRMHAEQMRESGRCEMMEHPGHG